MSELFEESYCYPEESLILKINIQLSLTSNTFMDLRLMEQLQTMGQDENLKRVSELLEFCFHSDRILNILIQ